MKTVTGVGDQSDQSLTRVVLIFGRCNYLIFNSLTGVPRVTRDFLAFTMHYTTYKIIFTPFFSYNLWSLWADRLPITVSE